MSAKVLAKSADCHFDIRFSDQDPIHFQIPMASIPTSPTFLHQTTTFSSTQLPNQTSCPLPCLPVAGRASTRSRAVVGSSRESFSPEHGGVGFEQSNVPVLSFGEVMETLKAYQENKDGSQHYLAMYSSVFGGITTDPAAMVICMDDHMVHRGHGVFDTAAVVDGHLYELDQHLNRFLRSASMAKIKLPFDRAEIRRVLINTVSASNCKNGSLRYWLSAGPGNFLLSPSGCPKSALYAVVIQNKKPFDKSGVIVITSSFPIKSPQFAIMKSVNYLPNALLMMEAEENGASAAIWLDDDGYVAEGPSMNVAFVTTDGMLLMPCFDKILSGCTAKRVLILAEELVKEGKLSGIEVRNVSVSEGKMAQEMMLIGSGVLVKPVLQWNDSVIGNGKEGPVTQALLDLILSDMKYGPPSVRTPVPY